MDPGLDESDCARSRPIAAELEAITLALGLAGETGCSLHVVLGPPDPPLALSGAGCGSLSGLPGA